MDPLARRTALGLALGAGGGLIAGCGGGDGGGDGRGDGGGAGPGSGPSAIPTYAASYSPPGTRQEGVDTPVPRQRFVSLRVLDLVPGHELREVLANLGRAADSFPRTDGLTITVGIGPTTVRNQRGDGFPGAAPLPAFATDGVKGGANGGDVLVQVCADSQDTAGRTAALLFLAAEGLRIRWGADGSRGDVRGRGARDVIGFYDGVSVPASPQDLDADVWTDASDGLADATVCVIRRIQVDLERWQATPTATQEQVVGRVKATGALLPGGVPDDAHAHRALPSVTGAPGLMLRRNYSYSAAPGDEGLLFISFQRRLGTFVRTQHALEAGDRLMGYTKTTGTGTFLIVPAWTPDQPLGSALFA